MNYTKMNYTLFQKSPSNKYLKAHVLFISIGVIELANLHKYITKSSNILNNLLVKSILNFAQFFSAGFSSGG